MRRARTLEEVADEPAVRLAEEELPSRAPPPRPGYVILDLVLRRPYLPVSWPTLSLATQARSDLLAPYPRGDVWRQRLKVREWNRRLPRSKREE